MAFPHKRYSATNAACFGSNPSILNGETRFFGAGFFFVGVFLALMREDDAYSLCIIQTRAGGLPMVYGWVGRR